MNLIIKLPFLLMVTLIGFSVIVENNKIAYVNHGTSSGFCEGYCYQEFTLINQSIQTKEIWWHKGKRDTLNYPDKLAFKKIEWKEWEHIVSKIEIDNFLNIPNVIGCPDCYDGGSEWVEVKVNGTVHRVTFERGETIEKLEPLLTELRRISKEQFKE